MRLICLKNNSPRGGLWRARDWWIVGTLTHSDSPVALNRVRLSQGGTCDMSMPSAETLEREKDKLFLTDAELIRRLGVPEKHMRRMLPGLESKYGFPRKQPLFGDRRYWPAVKAWLDKRNGLPALSNPAR
jgi:hypothetical protein